ncbi:hypothetical protein EYE40_10910 [Glaciihabitans arcticus]|uniref:Tandem-95 repeat protein n=1 Tax=Glaciihabitans arcticus TaxID=2668039 RepID=A0A4V2JF26_9MICO|nr:Ig-like domain-containing protein [Glaciihabitans arcticus]TBN57859.1 hypothetical protein EYE40_10910 [Glaciihabitans arcticus]
MARIKRGFGLSRKARVSLIKGGATVAIVGLLVGVAVVAEGFDVKQTPVNDSSIWALQVGEANRYARINTDLRELDTVRNVKAPSDIVQTANSVLLLAENNTKVADVDAKAAEDIDGESSAMRDTPPGTASVTTTGSLVGYLTGDGNVYVADIDEGAEANPVSVDPYADDEVPEGEDPRQYVSDAIAIGTDGMLYSYSSLDGTVLRYDTKTGEIVGTDQVEDGPTEVGSTLTVVGSTWVLLDVDGDQVLTSALGAVDTDLTGAGVLQASAQGGDRVYIAGSNILISINLGDGSVTDEFGGDAALGVPAQPMANGDTVLAAWLDGPSGTLWSSDTRESTPLDYAGAELATDPQPQFRGNGARYILNDVQSGWVWTVPDGELVPSSQDWALTETQEENLEEDTETATEVTEAKPPVAVKDSFGVRSGALVQLPVLLNDHDPNEDVLTVAPGTLSALPASFGKLSITNNDQQVTVQVADGAKGSATFSYAVTDGTREGGLTSAPTTVTLTVKTDQTAPVWCGVLECQQEWPSVEVLPGGSVRANVLSAWVDPQGDALYVKSVRKEKPSDLGSVAATQDGNIVFQHPNASSAQGGAIPVVVSVADARGGITEKTLNIQVTPTPSLVAVPFAVTTIANEPITIDPTDHVSGVNGGITITSANTGADDGSLVSLNDGRSTFQFQSPNAGSFLVAYTLKDAANEASSIVRVTVLSADTQAITTAPVTVFVRPKLDSTVDVFSAVSNPAGRVLLLSEALPRAANGAGLDVNVVDHRLIRVKGETASGQPGVLGTVRYTITDGTNTAGGTIQGEATIIQLATSSSQAPIALDDAVSVRAGSYVDVPVLENDVAADGNAMVLNPDALENSAKSGFAFTRGSVVRYIAPEKEGRYELFYGVYSAGTPAASDIAKISITVVPRGANGDPQPRTLTGRVLAGETVSIPFDDYGLDPDGDAVLLDGIEKQPTSGTATIAADGQSIIYTSVTGFKGPVEFQYRVKDEVGKTATASVRVGVLDAQSDPSPVTFSDYVEVQVGDDKKVSVYPAANDIDPAGKDLTLVDVIPDARAGSEEAAALDALIGSVDESGVLLNAGTELGTKTFIYTVVNSTGDTGIGLIVLKVVPQAVPDRPQIADTYVTLDQRAGFADGIDVVTGKVSWLSGELKKLKLSFYGDQGDLEIDGWKISGALPEKSAVIPFKLEGDNFFGEKVASYGYLHIPGRDDIILALASGVGPQNVKEKLSVEFDLDRLMAIPRDETLVVAPKAKITTTGARAEATCTLVSGTKVRYDAGKGEPWVDSCTVSVKLQGQKSYSDVLVPIAVEPEIAQPELRPASLTVSPAAGPSTFDLHKMTVWRGKERFDEVTYAIEYSGDQFEISLGSDNRTLTVESFDTSKPGKTEIVKVILTSHDGTSGTISVKVGPAPTALPQGGTINETCVVGKADCVVNVIGRGGEVNVYKNTPLKLVKVESSSTCEGVTFSVADNSRIRAAYAPDVTGAKCQVRFVVEDAQGKLSTDDGRGTFILDLHGYPKTPDSVEQAAFDDGSIRLQVSPGASASAYPDLTGFVIKTGPKKVGTCTTAGVCTQITGLTNGEKLTYSAYAVNSAGESLAPVTTLAWSYATPVLGTVERTLVYQNGVTSQDRGSVKISITGSDPTVVSYRVTGKDNVLPRTGALTETTVSLPVGGQQVSVTPISQFEIPRGQGDAGGTNTQTMQVAGLPNITDSGVVNSAEDSLTLAGTGVNDKFSAKPPQSIFIAYRGTKPTCSINTTTGGELVATAPANSYQSTTSTITVPKNREYGVFFCYSNGFGLAVGDVSRGFPYDQPDAPTGFTYKVRDGSGDGNYRISIQDAPAGEDGFYIKYRGYSEGSGADITGSAPAIGAAYCINVFGSERCSGHGTVNPVDANRSWQISVNVSGVTCVRPRLSVNVGGGAGGSATIDQARYERANGDFITPDEGANPRDIPLTAATVRNVAGTINWGGANSGLQPYQWTANSETDCSF